MSRIRLGCLAVVLLSAWWMLSAGCASEEAPPPPPPEAPAPVVEVPPTPQVPEAVQKALVEVVGLAPADAIALGTFRSPKAMVEQMNAFAGPELSALAAVPIGFLPPGVFDMEGPVGWTVFMSERGPAFVFVMRARPGAVLEGEDVGEGVTKLVLPALPKAPFYCALEKGWIVFSGDSAFVQAFCAAQAHLKVDEATAARVGQSLVWVRVDMKFTAAMAKGVIAMQRSQIQQGQEDPESADKAALLDWLEDLVDQLQTVELACDISGDAMTSHLRFAFKDDAALLDIARTLEPIATYEGMLPESDRLLVASWANVNWDQMTPRVKAFLQVPVDAALKQLDKMGGPAPTDLPEGFQMPPGPPFAAFGKSLREMWNLADDYQTALAGRHASLVEVPGPGEGLIWTTEVHALKDSAAFQVLVDKAMAVASDLVGAVLESMPAGHGGPKPDIDFEQVKNAETIEGVSIDQLRFHIGFAVPENAPPPVAEQMQRMDDMMKTLYGPEGLTFRVAIVENRALVALGGPDVMARAIRNARGEVGDLAKQPAVAEAIQRLPGKARLAVVVSGPAYAYMYGRQVEIMLHIFLSPEFTEALADVPLPALEFPAPGDLTTAALTIEGSTLDLSMHVPASEIERAVPVIRQAVSRAMFYGIHGGLRAVAGSMHPSGGMMHEEPWEPDEEFFEEEEGEVVSPPPGPGAPENVPSEALPEELPEPVPVPPEVLSEEPPEPA
ncbi:MAG: hypothetical protein WBD18_03110, partial [Phycisphaerae bacterium]